jgi:serine/threonine protein kinase
MLQEVLPLPEGVKIFKPSDYVLLGFGGSGAFGVIHKVKHTVSGDTFAQKTLDFKNERDKRDVASNELDILKSLNNENVLGCLGLFSAPGEIKILMELMDSDMRPFMSKDEKLLAKVAVKVLSGLKYLRENSILHLDINPANLLRKSGTDIIKIADFGCSINLSTAAEKVVYEVGTRLYGAPEIYCNGGITLSPTSPQSVFSCDIFSFGVSMLKFFEGKLPPNKYPVWYLVDRNKFCLPHYITNASENFQKFLECCLHKDPAKRSTVEELLAHPFITEVRANR